jgi:acyl dehydratase
MRLAPDVLMSQSLPPSEHGWSARDTVIYNLGIGFGAAATGDEQLLRYVLEEQGHPFPTMASVIGMFRPSQLDPACNVDAAAILHGEESIEILQPLTPHGRLLATNRICGIWDKGPEGGAVMSIERTLANPQTGTLVANVRTTLLLRNNGGFGGTNKGAPQLSATPDGEPDGHIDIATRPEQALIYRLSGDTNPLHSHPQAARRAGFHRPILMGLCTFALAARALVERCAAGDGDCLRALSARFSGPVFPGESIHLEYWRLSTTEMAFRGRVAGREGFALTGGRATFD